METEIETKPVAWVVTDKHYPEDSGSKLVFAATAKEASKLTKDQNCFGDPHEVKVTRAKELDYLAQPIGIVDDLRVLRQAGWASEDDNFIHCVNCDLYPMGMDEFVVCVHCERCKACGHWEDCPEGKKTSASILDEIKRLESHITKLREEYYVLKAKEDAESKSKPS